MDSACLTSPGELPPLPGINGPARPCLITPLQGSMPHALMYDLTHDNETPLHKRTAEDALSAGALVAFSYCAIGSVKGFDDLYPKLLDLVGDNRRYELAASEEYRGISKVKRVLNHLHAEMVLGGYSEGHVHQENDVRVPWGSRLSRRLLVDGQYIVMHRIQPVTQKGYIVVAHTAFPNTKMSKDRGWSESRRASMVGRDANVDSSQSNSPRAHEGRLHPGSVRRDLVVRGPCRHEDDSRAPLEHQRP